MAWRLAELGRFLDVRPASLALAQPRPDAVNIPFDELPKRLHELPPKDETILILETGAEAKQAEAFLLRGGRKAIVTPAPAPIARRDRQSYRLWRPNPFLESILPKLQPGRALDLGCGCGREALAMASAGFQVIAIDRLADSLAMGTDLERKYLRGDDSAEDAPIDWIQLDLESESSPLPRTGFDLITSFRYLHRPLLLKMGDLLNPGGSLLLETFTTLHRERHGKPSQDSHVLQIGEAPTLVPGLVIVHFEETWHGENHTARLWARKVIA